jgi:hypothetical protein
MHVGLPGSIIEGQRVGAFVAFTRRFSAYSCSCLRDSKRCSPSVKPSTISLDLVACRACAAEPCLRLRPC